MKSAPVSADSKIDWSPCFSVLTSLHVNLAATSSNFIAVGTIFKNQTPTAQDSLIAPNRDHSVAIISDRLTQRLSSD